MNKDKATNTAICRNAMEYLVSQEIKRQFQRLPNTLSNYINEVDVMTYAINRLPPLYACSQKGWEYQMLRGKQEYGKKIEVAVRQGLVAVQRDPLRKSVPLQAPEQLESDQALQQLKKLLDYQHLSWRNLPIVVERVLAKAKLQKIVNSVERTPRISGDWGDDHYSF